MLGITFIQPYQRQLRPTRLSPSDEWEDYYYTLFLNIAI